MTEPSALALATQDIIDRARAHLDRAFEACEVTIVPTAVPLGIQNATRELDRLEGVKRDWEQAMDDCLQRELERESMAEPEVLGG